MLIRRRFVQGVGAVALVLATSGLPTARAQGKKIVRIGFLAGSSAEGSRRRLAAFQQGLRDLGYIEGQAFTLQSRFAAGDSYRLQELATDLVRLEVDVLLAQGSDAAQAAKQATSVIPIVIGNASDPVGAGLVTSLARPGGNLTGLSDFNVGMVAKRLELLKAVAPSASRLAILLEPRNPTHLLQLQESQAAASTLSLALLPLEAEDADDIDNAFGKIRDERPEALIVFGFTSRRQQIVELVARSQLPAIYAFREFVEAGGLMSYGTSYEDLYRRAAVYVDKILKGTRPADLPVEQPRAFDFVINLKTAEALGLTVPLDVLAQVTELLE